MVGSKPVLGEANGRTLGRKMGAGDRRECGNRRSTGARTGGGGTNLVLTARRKDRLEKLAQELSSAHKIGVEISPPIWRERMRRTNFAYTQAKRSALICS